MTKVWFITGSARGLGRSLTEAVLAHGDKVAATARDPKQLNDLVEKYPGKIIALKLDVTRREEIRNAVAETIGLFGRIDVLVNNAGVGIVGATEAFTDEQVRSQLDINLYAPIEVSRAILPHMRKQRSGRILQISSVGGRVAGSGLSMYQTAKFGLGGFSEALAKEVAPLGIRVTSVEPGGFRTDWAGASMSFAPSIEGYENTVDRARSFLTSGSFVPMGDPDKAAQALIDLVDHPEPPVHLVLGSEAAGIVKSGEELRRAEFEKWLPVTVSTDADDAVNFLETEAGRTLMNLKAIDKR
ncbi:oxidoreductase [Chryseolinea soli]|uniref:SDR family NAD(P)-dependent oxidoreductase n=1 Tax=Chryseolinea soli TaxID=2321403 RepID=A0A385SK13_9BACT|nr:oxidoreductase [Chryseolinea soli]AYB29348.1 SDR family NAD(P)-dependent oxidoreductase [Chryseolinea soli]